MPTLGAALDFAKLEGRNFRAHQLSAAPSSPVAGQLYYDTVANALYYYNGTTWVAAGAGAGPADATTGTKGIVQLAGDLAGTAVSPQIAAGVIVDADVNAAAAIAESKLALATDAAAGTGSRRTLGTGAAQAAAGNDSRFTDARAPTGTAGGDLSGTYPNPQILAGTIVDTDVAAANKDGLVGVASLRTLGAGAQQAMPGNRTLDAIPAPVAPVGLNSQRITSVADPTGAQDAATKNYVDLLQQGLDSHPSVKAASTATLTLSGTQTVDGIALIAGDRCLAKDQTTPATNGIYVVAAGAWARAVDQDTWGEVPSAYVWVEQGTVNADTGWVCTADQGGTLNTTAITWVQFTAAGAAIAGAGLTKAGNTLDVGAGSGITVNADNVQVANLGITNAMIAAGTIDLTAKVTSILPVANGGTGSGGNNALARVNLNAAGYYSNAATHGAGTTISIPQATHGLRLNRGIVVQVQDNTSGAVEWPDVVVSSGGDVTITYAASVAANSKQVTCIG